MASFKFPAFIFFIVGCCLFWGGGYWLASTIGFAGRAKIVSGVVTKQIEETCQRDTGTGSNRHTVSYLCYQPFVKYEFQSKMLEVGMTARSSSGYETGSPVELMIDPENPNHAEFNGGQIWIFPLALLAMGAIFGSVGFFLLRSIYRKENLFKALSANGRLVVGKVTFCGPNTSLTINGRNPWVVEASWIHPESQQVYVAKTLQELWHDPVQMGQVVPNGPVQIKFDPKNPSQAMIVLGAASMNKVG